MNACSPIPNMKEFTFIGIPEDDVDAALLQDKFYNDAIQDMAEGNVKFDDEDEDIDLDVEYDDSDIVDDIAGIDADSKALKDAEEDLLKNPFEDDEVIDAALGNDVNNVALTAEDLNDDDTINFSDVDVSAEELADDDL